MKLLIFALLAFSHCFALKEAPAGYHWIPTIDGKFYLVHENEINQIETEPLKYDPYKDVGFRLYTNKNGREPELIEIDNADSLKSSSFDSSLESRLFVHGWGDDGIDGGAMHLVKDAYLDNGDVNFFAVDWSKGYTVNYIAARNRANGTGIVMGKFIEFLVREGGASLDSFRIIGFSLGGQIVGYTGKYLKGQLTAIYGVDPAGPLFFQNSTDRLTPEDAKYVEVIHTCGGRLGTDFPLGHVDFYPNNGRSQPGCLKIDVTGTCSHSRSLYYFAESMYAENDGFIGVHCNSRAEITDEGCSHVDERRRMLGGNPPKIVPVTERQVYWLRTNKKSPFSMGEKGTE
ncbi:pancreatic lipase-related protein 2-like [Culicoides brevitarsis]|uniref:pancreatic lipase-related protein 2-like n=1 Tax=Culicoides brevitarsis TaxID=469753 RepID=UPI00307B2925